MLVGEIIGEGEIVGELVGLGVKIVVGRGEDFASVGSA